MNDPTLYRRAKVKAARAARGVRGWKRRARRIGRRHVGHFADVSNNNGAVTRQQMNEYAKHHDVLIIKVSEGTDFVDREAAETRRLAVAEGLIVVPYHFAHPESNPAAAEAAHFIRAARDAGFRLGPRRKFWFRRRELPGVLDYEIAGRSDYEWINDFAAAYRHATHHGESGWHKDRHVAATRGPILYSGATVREQVNHRLSLFYWLAAYTESPANYWPDCIPTHLRLAWQYSESEHFPGLGQTDGSVFYGRIRDLMRLAT